MANKISVLNGDIILSYDWIKEKCKPKESDSIIVGGTLIEGMGNKESDLDIYVLTDEFPLSSKFKISNYAEVTDENDEAIIDLEKNKPVYSLYDYIDNSKIHFDVKYIKIKKVEEIKSIIDNSYAAHLKDTNIYYSTNDIPLNYEDFMFFHRIFGSICIMNNELHNRLRLLLSSDKFCLLSYSEYTLDYFSVKDVQGAIEANDLFLAREVTRELVVKQAQALIFSYGFTNRNKKWIYFYLKSNIVFKEAFDVFENLMSLPTRNKMEIINFIEKSIEFIEISIKTSHKSPLFKNKKDDISILKDSLCKGYQSNFKKDHDIAKESYGLRLLSYEETDINLNDIIFPS